MGIPCVVDGLGELGRVREEEEVLSRPQKAQTGFPDFASAHKSWVGFWWERVGDGGPFTSGVGS